MYQEECIPRTGRVRCNGTGLKAYTLNITSPASGNGTCSNPTQYENCALQACPPPAQPGRSSGNCCNLVIDQYVLPRRIRICLEFTIDNVNPSANDYITCTPNTNLGDFDSLDWMVFLWFVNGQTPQTIYDINGAGLIGGVVRPSNGNLKNPPARFRVGSRGTNIITCHLYGRGFEDCPNQYLEATHSINVS